MNTSIGGSYLTSRLAVGHVLISQMLVGGPLNIRASVLTLENLASAMSVGSMDAAELDSAQAEHASHLLMHLQRMRATQELTDVVLLTEGVAFHCHKVVLSAFSAYFQAMFTCGLRETQGAEVLLRDVPAKCLQLLLDYMYQGNLPLDNDNIQAVAAAAFLLDVDGAFRICQNHMEANMDPSNCVGLYHWARNMGATGLADCALRYMCQHFAEVCEEEEVLELDAQSLGSLLCSDDLNISQEQVLLELVLRWAQRRRGDLQSETEAAELLRHVRLELVEPAFLRKARRRNPILLQDAECSGMIGPALQPAGLCETAAPTRPALRYGMETTDLLLCLERLTTSPPHSRPAEARGRSQPGQYHEIIFWSP
ncbi:hypothetical protein fugu_007231 [Takifugu bimaculatus]|uniref:BTB domain-containing protein n=1 Tax=Takifugu bimaculatus TaxID=433685 RepID=A0A4Z2B3S2_9TELE|nr:hypothetical protein fugu_007231 [Takifugu bimaculatus]